MQTVKTILKVLFRLTTIALPLLGIDLGLHLMNWPSDLALAGVFLLLVISGCLLGVALCSAFRPLASQIQEAFRAAGPGCCVVLIALTCLSTTACSQRASEIDASDAVDIAQTVRYVHDKRTGVCYAVVASRHVTDFSQNGFTITYVPCTPEVLKIIGTAE